MVSSYKSFEAITCSMSHMSERMYLIPIFGKTDGAKKKEAQDTNSSDRNKTDANYCCKTLSHGWVLTDELHWSICDRIASSGLVTPYWRVTYLFLVYSDKRSRNFANL